MKSQIQETDPLLALAGTLQSDVTDVSERHDDYIAAALLAELRCMKPVSPLLTIVSQQKR